MEGSVAASFDGEADAMGLFQLDAHDRSPRQGTKSVMCQFMSLLRPLSLIIKSSFVSYANLSTVNPVGRVTGSLERLDKRRDSLNADTSASVNSKIFLPLNRNALFFSHIPQNPRHTHQLVL